MIKAYKDYIKNVIEMADISEIHYKSIHDTNTKKKDCDKAQADYDKKSSQCQEAVQRYYSTLEDSNILKNSYYSDLESILNVYFNN